MELSVTSESDSVHFKVKGVIDEKGAEHLKQRFRELGSASFKELTIDFHEVTHIGSAGIGKLLLFYKGMAVKGGKIRLENLSQTLYELFMTLKLDTIFMISKA
jgi:anti-sigma B factor antagonist